MFFSLLRISKYRWKYLTLILTGYEHYTFLIGCEPDMWHIVMTHQPGFLIYLAD